MGARTTDVVRYLNVSSAQRNHASLTAVLACDVKELFNRVDFIKDDDASIKAGCLRRCSDLQR